MRLFAGIVPDASTRQRLAAAASRLPPIAGRIRLVPPENLHLTLRFLGDVDRSRISAITECLSAASREVPAFEVDVRGLVAFPSPARPRVIGARVVARPELAHLFERVGAGLAALGFPRERLAFSPHVTLLRIRGGRSIGADLPDVDFGRLHVREVTLLESDLRPDGARYRALAHAPLSRSE